MRLPIATLFAFLLAACTSSLAPIPDHADDRRLLADVRAAVAELGPGARAAVWLGRPGQSPTFAWNVDVPMPCASAIKAAYLVELFAARSGALDTPLPGADAVLADDAHFAIAHFTPQQRTTARTALGGASTRRIAEAMISSKGVDNATYNIAANLVTAFLGGPTGLHTKLHTRHPEWTGLHVRRYMIRSRTENGDNEATARALAAVHASLAARDVPGLAAADIAACRDVLQQPADAAGRARFAKSGALDSSPVTRVAAGWCETPEGPLVHVVMLAQDDVPADELAAAGARLGAATRRIERMLLAPR
jgi:hypothetical protein